MPNIMDSTWEEIRDLAVRDAVALVPTGSCEQHGPHLPVEVDTRLINEICVQATARVEKDTLVALAPTLWLGCSPHHLPFFAMTVDAKTYQSMIVQIGRSLIAAGFSRLIFINGHGGNEIPLALAVDEIRAGAEVLVGKASAHGLALERVQEIRDSTAGGIAHAGERETAMMMAVRPGSVREDKVVKNVPTWKRPYFGVDFPGHGPLHVGYTWPEVTKVGHLGDPTLATSEKGKAFLEAAVDGVAEALRQFSRWDRSEFAELEP